MLDEGNQVSFVTSQNQYSKVEKDDMTALSMEQLYFVRVLYLSPDEETEEHKKYEVHLKGIKNVLEEFTDEYLKNTDNAQHFKNFLPRIFLPIAHLIKNADYKHEKEWRLLHYTPIKKELPFIKRNPLRIETEEILFKDKENKEEIWLGPNISQYPELEKMKIQHLFEYDGIADCVEITALAK